MDEKLRAQVYKNLILQDTEDLIEIWQKQNTDEWDVEVFKIVKEILLKRLGEVPPLAPEFQAKQILSDAKRYFRAKNYHQALSECERAIQTMPDFAIAYNQRGLVYDEMGELEKAIADYQKATLLDPTFQDAWHNMHSVEEDIEEGFYESLAIEHLDQALEYIYDNNLEKALEEANLAKELLPEIAIAYNYLGLILEELGELASARKVYLKATQLNPQFYPAWTNLENTRIKEEEALYHQISQVHWDDAQDDEIFPALSDEEEREFLKDAKPIPGWLYTDEKAFLLRGYPGYRTHPGRNIYDPLNTNFELARIEGIIFRSLFTFKFRTHNPIYLFFMTFLGFIYSFPLLLAIIPFLQGDWNTLFLVILYIPYSIAGLLLLVNIFLSITTQKPETCKENGNAFF